MIALRLNHPFVFDPLYIVQRGYLEALYTADLRLSLNLCNMSSAGLLVCSTDVITFEVFTSQAVIGTRSQLCSTVSITGVPDDFDMQFIEFDGFVADWMIHPVTCSPAVSSKVLPLLSKNDSPF